MILYFQHYQSIDSLEKGSLFYVVLAFYQLTFIHIIVAPTGIAAINAFGVTIHSLFEIPQQIYFK
ncbi:hypothetical protein FW780_18680 [Chryseobacterium sediminis]|uniref:Uncharacterized protein n=1 Tax=Chryseobacterium sediminis TaxID=1679494 RepID=A0A5B2TT33_9FLAO|nr:hypothetical protein FW780_18680 [Chryseobacterium sediminis]